MMVTEESVILDRIDVEKSKECTQNTYAGDRQITEGKSEE